MIPLMPDHSKDPLVNTGHLKITRRDPQQLIASIGIQLRNQNLIGSIPIRTRLSILHI